MLNTEADRERKLRRFIEDGLHVVGFVLIFFDEPSQTLAAESGVFPEFANNPEAIAYVAKLKEIYIRGPDSTTTQRPDLN